MAGIVQPWRLDVFHGSGFLSRQHSQLGFSGSRKPSEKSALLGLSRQTERLNALLQAGLPQWCRGLRRVQQAPPWKALVSGKPSLFARVETSTQESRHAFVAKAFGTLFE